MRTTSEIDDDVLLAARELAEAHKSTAGKVLSDLARKALGQARKTTGRKNGIPLLPLREGARFVTAAKVEALLDDESAEDSQ